jgi:hypothetical protein
MNDVPGSEFPSQRADVELVREKTGIRLEGSAGPVKAKVQVTTDGSARSPASVAVTILLLVTASCIPAVLLGTVGWLVHAPAWLLTTAAAGLFLAVFAMGTALAFHQDRQLPPAAGFHPVLLPRPVIQDQGNGSAQSRSPKAIHSSGKAEQAPAATRRKQPRPSRR